MISEECKILIHQLVEGKKSFAVYRIPGEDRIRYVEQTSGFADTLSDIKALNKQSGFVIAPFRLSDETPIVLIRGEEKSFPIAATAFIHNDSSVGPNGSPVDADYAKKFQTFMIPLRDSTLTKLVLSRTIERKREVTFSVVDAFLRACERYIRSYVYLYYTPNTGTWLGGTPEILLSGQAGAWHTVALAGTQPLQQGELPAFWDEKNKEEQQMVAHYICNQLASLGMEAQTEEAYTVRAGELAHIKSDFHFSLPDNNHLGDLLELLHPTPAVCGLPKDKAYQFILDNEGYNRRYYSGFLGLLNPEGRTDLYVNLRCMKIGEETLTLYAGGGLLASSVLEDEWKETEDKLQTMKKIVY